MQDDNNSKGGRDWKEVGIISISGCELTCIVHIACIRPLQGRLCKTTIIAKMKEIGRKSTLLVYQARRILSS